ncbi:hypothetical protein EIK56_23030 [Sphingomonas sp. C8-2]|nr:hypothetical protein EIK56_23030 [Sphingomonas sp. C8-2]
MQPGATPLAAIDAIMALYGRENVELAIESLIEMLDALDGDPDLEEDNEDRCSASDDAPAAAYVNFRLGEHEDDEDDDPAGGTNAEDDFDLRDVGYAAGAAGPGCSLSDPGYDPLDDGESDGDCDTEPDDPFAVRRIHRNRIRRTRCREIRRPRWSGGWYIDGYLLDRDPVAPSFRQLRRTTGSDPHWDRPYRPEPRHGRR